MEKDETVYTDSEFIRQHNKIMQQFGNTPDEVIDNEPRDTHSDIGSGDLDDEQYID